MHLPHCPVLIVGNEVLLRKDRTEEELLRAIRGVKEETGLLVAYADVPAVWSDHPKVVEAVDVCLVHLYPFWDGQPIEKAADALVDNWSLLKKTYPGKRLVIGETGWPSAGEAKDGAVPSPANQARYFAEFVRAVQTQAIDYFYFDMFDEAWKAKQEGDRGANLGAVRRRWTD